jgi:conjugative transfer signal peptidase TraF
MKRVIFTFLAGVVIVSLVVVTLFKPTPRLVWNASASAPIGLYWIAPVVVLRSGDLLAVRAPEQVALWIDERGYLPFTAILLKRVAALSGTEVCRRGASISVAGTTIAEAKIVDVKGRSLPQWRGCRRLGPGEIFLVNANVPDSLDGRYFGPFPRSSIVGLAYPIWIDEENDGRH